MEHSFLEPAYVMHEVNGHVVRFYATSVGMIFKLKGLVGPLSHALAVLFSRNDTDTATKFMKDTTNGIPQGEVHEVEAIDPKLAGQRAIERQRALQQLVEAVCNKQNGLVLAEVILDSIREREDPPAQQKQIAEFLQQLTVPITKELLMGVAKANQDVFGPLGERVRTAVDRALQSAPANEPGSVVKFPDASPESSDSDPSEAGESSKTP